MPREKKDELLRRQSEASARHYVQMPQDKKDDLFRHRREANAAKKKVMPPSASNCVSKSGVSKRKRVDYTQNTPLDPVGTGISILDTSVHAASNENIALVISDELVGRASYFDVQSEDELSSDDLPYLLSSADASLGNEKHGSSSGIANFIPWNGQQGIPYI